MKKNRKDEVIDKMIYAFSEFVGPKKAVELRILCLITGVKEAEALRAIGYLIKIGMDIKLTDSVPHKFYRKENVLYLDGK